MRKLIRDMLKTESYIKIVDEATNGAEAVSMAQQYKPDIITMDYTMPILNGAQATSEIVKNINPPPAVIMLSAYTEKGARATFDSLSSGAIDFIQKPSGELSFDLDLIKESLVHKINIIYTAKKKIEYPTINGNKASINHNTARNIEIIVIGASTGGPPLIENIIASLPKNIKVPVLVIQHMPKKFTKSFASRLNSLSNNSVKEAENNDKLKPGIILIAPGDYHTIIDSRSKDNNCKIIKLIQTPPIKGLRPSIDIAMDSVASIYGHKALGILLTGMGDDGAKGLEQIKQKGGHTIVQDPNTAVIDSMPMSAIKINAYDEILDISNIISKINKLTK